jgi:hypothetical protein
MIENGCEELHDLVLGPVAVVLRGRLADEATVTAVSADPQVDMRVAGDPRIVKRR